MPKQHDYTFGMYGDDGCLLYLSTDEDPANKQLIAGYNGWTNEGDYDSDTTGDDLDGSGKQISDPITLEAGKRYYIEAAYKQSSGGDGIGVSWTGPSVQDSFNEGVIPGKYLSTMKTLGPIKITNGLPAEVNATELRSATIEFGNDPFDGKVPYSVHWYSNDVPTGVSGNSYTIDRVLPSYDGDQYYAIVTNYFSAATSQVVTLNVDYDTEPPQVDSAGSLVKNNVAVVFNEPIGFAQNSNFTLYDSETNEVTINSVSLGGEIDGRSIVNLNTPLLETGEEYTVVTSGIQDAALDPNTMIEPSTNSFTPFNFDGYQRINNSQNWTAIAEGNQITMTAGGADIWYNADEFVYIYKKVSGNFDVAMRCVELEDANDWSKLGLMMRQSTDPGSIHRFNSVTPPEGANNFYCTQARDTDNSDSVTNDSGRPAATFPNSWMRLQKAGDMVYFYKSEDGENWELYGWQSRGTTAFTEPFLVGIALTSHNTAATATAVVDNFQEIPMLPVEIVTQPQSRTIAAGTRATYTVEATGSTPTTYQWKVDGVEIQGATNATYTTPGLLYPDDDGSQYSVVVDNVYGDPVESDVAVLTVTEDETNPAIYSVTGNDQYNQVTVTFDEWMDETTAINMANYSLDKGLTINSATLVNNTNVVLETSTQTAGEVYTVTVNGVEDINGNTIEPDSTAQFTAFVFASGFMKLERFYSDANNAIGGEIESLTNCAKYTADNPDEVLTTSFFGAPRDITDNFGQRVTGLLVPPVSGDYTFHIASDDDSRLYISDDDSPANFGDLVCSVDGYSGYAEWDGANAGDNQASDPITLTGGEQYYVMAINSDGGGGDGVEVGWEYSGSDGIEIIGSEHIGILINQDQSVITITNQPQDQTVTENRPAVFEIGASGTFEYGESTPSYQWQRDGADIPDATSSTYEIPITSINDNGAVFTCKVMIPGATVISDPATLNIIGGITNAVRRINGTKMTINLIIPPGSIAWGAEEYLPEGLTPANYSENNGVWDPNDRKLSWWGTGDESVELSYSVSGPDGEYTIEGNASIDGSDEPITGDNVITISSYHPADENEDWRLVMSETIGYIAGWQNGDNPMDNAIRGAYIWQNGEEYECDNTKDEPLCWVLAMENRISSIGKSPSTLSVPMDLKTITNTNKDQGVDYTSGSIATNNIALINPDHHRILKHGRLATIDGEYTYWSIASGTVVASRDSHELNPDNWRGVGTNVDFITKILADSGYSVSTFEATNTPQLTPEQYGVVIIQDPLRQNIRLFSKDVENNPADLLQHVTSDSFLQNIRKYYNAGGNLVLVGDAIRLLENGEGRLGFNKIIISQYVSHSVTKPSNLIPNKWLFIRGNPFCGVDRKGSGEYMATEGTLIEKGSVISKIDMFNGNDWGLNYIWSDTLYRPTNSTNLLTVSISGTGEYVLIGSTCSPPVYTVSVDDKNMGFMGYTTYQGRKIYYITSDSFFDYRYVNHTGSWHTHEYQEIKCSVTEAGKRAIRELIHRAIKANSVRSIYGTNVNLKISVAPGSVAWGVEEYLPEGLTPVNYSENNGVWDPNDRKLSWWGTGDESVGLSYSVSGPDGEHTIKGNASFDGSDEPITGDNVITISSYHPADENEDWRLLMSETIGYIAGWQNGDNPMDYAIRGAYIWQNGEEYECDNTKDEPLCWVLAMDGLRGQMAETPQAASAGDAERTVIGYDVNIEVTPTVGTNAWGYEEYIPEGITPTDITGSNGAWDSENRKISWWGTGDAAIELGYTVSGAPGTYKLSGTANFDGTDQGVTGDTNIVIYSDDLKVWINENLPNGEVPEEMVMSLEQAYMANIDPTQEFKIDEFVLGEEGKVVLKWDNAYGLPNGDIVVQCCTNLSVEQPIWFEISPDVDGVSYDAKTGSVELRSSDIPNVESMYINISIR